jgi:multidrug efflux pump subunit AcrB
MWIVRLALRRPYTFAVFALLLLILGPLSILNTPTDIFPNIDIPVVSIVWQYQGLSAVDMANRIVTLTERTLTTTVDNIDHIESQSLVGVAVVKVYFQPKVTLATAIAQIPREPHRLWSSPTRHRVCLFCSLVCPVRGSPNSS